jgi:ketosteroid isomerase-like protein
MMFEQRRDQLLEMYRAFNARDIQAATALMHPEVEWPNGWEGGHVHGPAEVRDYWTRQWAAISPALEPRAIDQQSDGRVSVHACQTVRDHKGRLVSEKHVRHLYTFEDGLVRRMEIEEHSK